MSIIRDSASAPSSDISQSRDRDRAPDPQRAVDPAARQRFQALMREGQLKEHADSQASVRKGDEFAAERGARPFAGQHEGATPRPGGAVHSAEPLPPAEVAAIWQAQQLAGQAPGTTTATPTPPVNSSAFAELLERHVRQLAISEGTTAADEGQVLLRMADSTLAGTDLLLSRTSDGWLLRADVRSRDSFDAIRDAADQLSARFAERGLGSLTIEPHLNE